MTNFDNHIRVSEPRVLSKFRFENRLNTHTHTLTLMYATTPHLNLHLTDTGKVLI